MKKLLTILSGLALFSAVADTGTHDSPYGVCAHICKGDQWKLAEPKFQVLKPAGISWVRNGFTWAQAEPEKGRWDFSKLDLVAETAEKYDMNILPILAYQVPWAHPVYQHLDLWREYVHRTVSRYAKQFRYWEVWNEANINEGGNTKIPAKEYVKVLQIAYDEIKQIDPALQVVFTGTAGVPIAYIEECLKLGAAKYFDVMNVHPYASGTYPENTALQMDPLFALFKKYDIKKPIWVTEFSWPTNTPKQAMTPALLKKALNKLNLDPGKTTLAIIRNPDLEEIYLTTQDYTREVFPLQKEITYADLKNLDVKQYPVLLPTLTQAFPRQYFPDVVDYVKRGGVILHSHGLPFYCDAKKDKNGKWQQIQAPNEKMLKDLHIQYLVAWRDKVPSRGKVKAAPGVELPDAGIGGGERYLSTKNLKSGDQFTSFFLQESEGFSAPVVGLYQFNSDLKGGVLADVTFNKNGVTQKQQGKFLPRAYLYFLSNGIEKIFWYKFRAEERSAADLGGNFGIVHNDYSPRDAFNAYRTLIEMHPAGSSRPVLKNDGNLYWAVWKRPDGTPVHAYWTMFGEHRIKLPFTPARAFNYLGQPQPVTDHPTVTDGILYLLEK